MVSFSTPELSEYERSHLINAGVRAIATASIVLALYLTCFMQAGCEPRYICLEDNGGQRRGSQRRRLHATWPGRCARAIG